MELSQELYKISPSQFSVHKECARKHSYVYGQSLRPKARETKFEVGSYWHELAHHYYKLLATGYTINDPEFIHLFERKLIKDLENCKPAYQKVLFQVHIMFRRFIKMQSHRIDSNIEIVAVEEELLVPISDNVQIQGIADLLYRRTGKLVLRDHKTGEFKSAHSEATLEYNDQLLTYAAMVWKLWGEIPDIEISWINAKVDYKSPPTREQLFGLYTKPLTKRMLEGFWTYLEEYVYYMESSPPIRALNGFRCKGCVFKEPCLFDLRGEDETPLIEALFKVVPRDYDFQAFTELSNKNSSDDSESVENSITLPGGIRLSFDD